MTGPELYLTSIYFTVETITTVGYGDVDIRTVQEKLFCMASMIIGVFTFSFTSGQLSSILASADSQRAIYEKKLFMINKIQKEYYIPLDLYYRIHKAINYSVKEDINDLNVFVEELPSKLKVEVSLFIHEETYKKILFLNERDD